MTRLCALLLASALVLAACASRRPEAAPAGRAVLGGLTTLASWRASGRLATAAPGGGFNASFDWRERDGTSAIDVRGPFGAGATHLARTASRIDITSGAAAPLTVDAPFAALESVLEERLGFAVPITALRFWMLGVADPGVASDPQPGDGFRQAGWRVQCVERREVPGAPSRLPRRLLLERDRTRIRIVIDRWEVPRS